ncbi:MAG: hypothetical protein JSV36_04015 [Anaerolineae bacterium]|nr:MAG: hypothetical protein JSV36_04015 [Anaerolineae bacterium]
MPDLSAWLTSPLLPALALVLGAGLTWLARRFLSARRSVVRLLQRMLPFFSALAAGVAIWSLRRPVPFARFWSLSLPTLGLDSSLWVQLDGWGRLFGLFLLWPALATAGFRLFSLSSRVEGTADAPAWPWWLLLLAAVQVVLAAGDWLTLSAALILFDIVCLVTVASRAEGGWGFLVNGLSGLLLLAVAFMLSSGGHSLVLDGRVPPLPAVALLVTAAVLVRLAPYPLHFWLPGTREAVLPAWHWPMRLASPVMGLYLMARLAPRLADSGLVTRLTLMVGVVGCLVAALVAWLAAQRGSRKAIPLIGLYQVNLALASWAVSDEPLVGLWTSLALIMAVAALVMHRTWLDGRENGSMAWWSAVPGGLAAAALAGLPLTAGLFVRQPLYRVLLHNRQVGWLALLLIAEAMLTATLLYLWGGLRPGIFTWREMGERVSWRAWGLTALLAAPLLLLGSCPSLAAWLARFPPTMGSSWTALKLGQLVQGGIGLWAALLLPLVMGYGLCRSGVAWPAERSDVEARLILFLRLGWLHRALDWALGQVRQALWTVGAVLHGEGYLAWMSFSLLLIFLFVLGQ